MASKETETLDKLYLEWSQFTNARTSRELSARDLLKDIEFAYRNKLKSSDKKRIQQVTADL